LANIVERSRAEQLARLAEIKPLTDALAELQGNASDLAIQLVHNAWKIMELQRQIPEDIVSVWGMTEGFEPLLEAAAKAATQFYGEKGVMYDEPS